MLTPTKKSWGPFAEFELRSPLETILWSERSTYELAGPSSIAYFFLSYCPLIITPLWGGGLTLSGSFLILAFFQSSLLLRRSLNLVADIVMGCRVVNVVLCYRVYDNISNVIGPICSGYVLFHSVEFLSQQLSSFSGLFEAACLTPMFRELKIAHI